MKIAVLAGEISGDNYGALLVKKLMELNPGLYVFGVGGEKMKKTGMEIIENIPQGTMGFSGVIKKLPAFYLSYKNIVKKLIEKTPDLVVFIDNPGFNLKIAQSVGRKFPCYYYIPPKIWAHNYGRIKIMRRYLKGVIPVFPFEADIYKKEKIPCSWFGHPIVDIINFNPEKEEFFKVCQLKENKPVIGILPGSRKEEVLLLMPHFLKIINTLKKKIDFQIVFSAVNEEMEKVEKRMMKKYNVNFPVWKGSSYSIMKFSNIVLAASGTVTLEIALFKKPFLVFYKISLLNYLIAKFVVKLKSVSPLNIILQEDVVPEYLQKFSEEEVCKKITELTEKGFLYQKEMNAFEKLNEILNNRQVTNKIAEFLLNSL